MTRVADFAQSQRIFSYILETQKRLNEEQVQASSGKKSQTYTGIAPDVRRLVNLESAHSRTAQFVANNKLVDDRLQVMETNVSDVFDVISKFKSLLINARNANNSADLTMPIQAKSMLDQIASLLNVQQDGRYLFAGSRTDTRPVDESALPVSFTIPSADGSASAYYQGDSVKLSVQADENYSVDYGVTADDPAFEQAIRALQMVIVGPPNDPATLDEALRVTNQAIDGVSNVRTRIGDSRAALDSANKRHDEFQLFAEKTISDIQNADVTQVISKLNSDQVALEASFTALGRLSQLTLSNFLR